MEKHRGFPPSGSTWLFIAVAATSLVSGCESTDSGQPPLPSFSRTDSAGVLISVTQGPDARAAIGWEVDSLPDLVIGEEDSSTGYLFRVQGVRGLSDGGVLVVDGGSRELRFIDSDGHLVSRVGRRGRGPGEFQDPVLVPTWGTDSLLVWDKGLRRFQILSNQGEDPRTILLTKRWPAGLRPPHGAVGLHMLVRKQEMVVDLHEFRAEGLKQLGAEYLWVNPSTGVETSIANFMVVQGYMAPTGGPLPALWSIPFSSRPSGSVSQHGALLTNGRASEVREYDLEGRLCRIFRVDEAARPVNGEMIEAMIDLATEADPTNRESQRWVFGKMPIPETLPAFRSLQVDAMGWLWAEVYEWDPTLPPKWMVFDLDGRARGTLTTPKGLVVEWIGTDYILGVWIDDLGREFVRRYALKRELEESLVS